MHLIRNPGTLLSEWQAKITLPGTKLPMPGKAISLLYIAGYTLKRITAVRTRCNGIEMISCRSIPVPV
jgi:hypothetical protein